MILSGLPLTMDGLYFVGDHVPNGPLSLQCTTVLCCACHWVCGLIGPASFWFVPHQAMLALCQISCTVTL